MHRIRYQRNQTIYVCICWFGIYLALCTMKFIVWMSGYNRTDNGTEMTKVSSRLSHKRKQRSICLWSISFNRYLSGDSIFILQSLKTSKMRKLAQHRIQKTKIPRLRHLCSTIYSMFTLQPSYCFWSFIINMKTPFDPSKEFLIEYCLTTETLPSV